MIPNDAETCHYCGAPQAQRESTTGKKLSRCPRCMSFLYDPETGCQFCGYQEKKPTRIKMGRVLLIFLIIVFIFFVLWQFGLIPFLPGGGKLVSIQIEKKAASIENAFTPTASLEMIVNPNQITPGPTNTEFPPSQNENSIIQMPNGINNNMIRIIVATAVAEGEITANAFPEADKEQLIANTITNELEKMLPNTRYAIPFNGVPQQNNVQQGVPATPLETISPQTLFPSTPNPEQQTVSGTFDPNIICGRTPTRFSAGAKGQMSGGNRTVNLRSEPGLYGTVIASILPKDTFMIENETPVCTDDYLWIKIRIDASGEIGWAAEANGVSYILTPVE